MNRTNPLPDSGANRALVADYQTAISEAHRLNVDIEKNITPYID